MTLHLMHTLLLASCMVLASCAAPTPTTVPVATTVRFDPAQTAALRKNFEGRGWAYMATSASPTTGVQSLHFVEPRSLARFGSIARIRVVTSHAAPLAISGASSSNLMYQFDCNARTQQVVNGAVYADTMTTTLKTTYSQGAVTPVGINTVNDLIMVGACTGRLPTMAGGTAQAGQRRGGSGSGTAIASKVVLTNQHVVGNCASVDVIAAGNRHPATVRKQDAVNDLALLDVPALPEVAAPAVRRQANTGEPVMVAGYPLAGVLGSDMVVTDGLVNSLSGLRNNAAQLQISAPVQPGNSGGPLLDRSGNLVGVVVSKFNALGMALITGDVSQNINFAIKPEIVNLFLQSENLTLNTSEGSNKMDTQALASVARTFTVKVDCKP